MTSPEVTEPKCPVDGCGSHQVILYVPTPHRFVRANEYGTHGAGWQHQGETQLDNSTVFIYPDALGHCADCGHGASCSEFFKG